MQVSSRHGPFLGGYGPMLLLGLCGGQGRGGWSGIKHLFVCHSLSGSLSVSGPGGNQLLEKTSGWRKQWSGV